MYKKAALLTLFTGISIVSLADEKACSSKVDFDNGGHREISVTTQWDGNALKGVDMTMELYLGLAGTNSICFFDSSYMTLSKSGSKYQFDDTYGDESVITVDNTAVGPRLNLTSISSSVCGYGVTFPESIIIQKNQTCEVTYKPN